METPVTKPITLPSFETFVKTGRHGPPLPVPGTEKITNAIDKRTATVDELKQTRHTLAVLIDRYGLKRYAVMRVVGLGNSTYPEYFKGDKPVPYQVLERLSEVFLCKSVGDFFRLHEKQQPKGLRSHLEKLNLISTHIC